MPAYDEYISEIKDLWDNRWLTNMGIKHQQLESELSRYFGTTNVSLYANGHLALENIISALNLSGEVITTPFTFISTTHAILRNNLTPVFCDINPFDYNIDVDKIEELITDKTSAIIPVHVYGNVCNVKKIDEIAKKYNLKVIYDAAHAFGVNIEGVDVSNFGDASMFSFHATKVFNTIEGGAVTFNDKKLKNKLNSLKNFGITGQETIDYVGGNAKMNEFQAAMGLCNLRHVDKEILKRKHIVSRYRENLKDLKSIRLIEKQKNVKSNYAYFPILFLGEASERDKIFEIFKNNNIMSRKYFYPLTNSIASLESQTVVESTPNAEYVSKRILALPLYAELGLKDVDRICDILIESCD